MNGRFGIWTAALAGVFTAVAAGAAALPADLEEEARAAAAKGAAWLASLQQEDGHWDMPETPALTALSVWALQRTDAEAYREAIDKGAAFVLSNVQPDGSIWHRPAPGERGGGLANYNTAVCLSALHSLGRPELVPVLQRARSYLAGTQYRDDGLFRGGIGYSPDEPRPHADLSNSHMVYEAMRLTQDVEDLRAEGEARADLDWDAALAFLAQVQNLPGVNTNAWVSGEEEDKGGFIYRPAAVGGGAMGGRGGAGGPPAAMERREMLERGVDPGARGDVVHPSQDAMPPPRRPAPEPVVVHPYGSMTYAGILSLVYCKVDPDDPRLAAAKDWAARHWTVEENPGMGQEGLYYFFNTLTKCMAAIGDETVAGEDGAEVSWREAVVRKLLSLQAEDGSWCNDNNRWWEADPNLVTAYTLLALATAME